MPKTRTTRRATPRSITVLAYSEDEQVMRHLRSLVAELKPEAEIRCAHIVDDAVRQGADAALTLALLDQSHGRRLSPLIRLLRRHSPHVKVLVFAHKDAEHDPRITCWDDIGSSVARALDSYDRSALQL